MTLHALSPLDGRYSEAVASLQEYFSEYAYLRARIRIELGYLSALSDTGLLSETGGLGELSSIPFTEQDAREVQEIEKFTRHDVKAIEYFLRRRLPPALHAWIHFGLTSEDVNNLAQAIALRDSRDQVLLPALRKLSRSLVDFAGRHRAMPMLARTHGQPAVPTTLGKEIAVYIARLRQSQAGIATHRFQAKLTGAVGNFNALTATAPGIDWAAFSTRFIEGLGLEPNLVTSQTLPPDNWITYFQSMQLTNAILIDYTQDIWRYISDGYLKQAVVEGEVGSSTMPQKVNPIDFENAEGNLGIANALFAHYAHKLPISRLQRDLSDSTVRRTFGVALGHTLLAWQNIYNGMARVAPDEDAIRSGLESHWEVISEGVQTILRALGRSDAYESLRSWTRGRALTEEGYRLWLKNLDVDEETRTRLADLSPFSYIGLAIEITDSVTGGDPSRGESIEAEDA